MGWSRPPAHVAAYGAAALLVLVFQWWLWNWAIEDAAISLAFAKHIAEGLGPVAYPGGPYVEGYSNPLWVALLVPFLWLGVEPFPLVRWLGLVLSLGGIAATAAAARPSLGHRGAALAGLAFAAYAPMNIWAQSGLENSLYSLLLALGLWRLQVDQARSWAAPCFLGLALTRPEAAGLAPLAFVVAVARAMPRGRVGERVSGWVTWALLPFVAYHGLRYATFAAELPATAYAKVDDVAHWERFDGKSWRYLRRFAIEGGFALWLPVMFLAVAGPANQRGAPLRRGVAVALTGLLALGLLGRATGTLPDDGALALALGGGAVLMGLGVADRGARTLFLAAGAYTVVFSLLTGGDWMKGWRWFSLVSVPVAYAVAAFLDDVLRQAPDRRGQVVVGLVLAAFVGHQGWNTWWVADKPGVSPWSIKRRVDHYVQMMDTLQLRRRPLVVDQDMGANVLWGSEHYDARDAKGLTDLPFALHRPRPVAADALLVDDVFEEPTFVHMHVVTKHTLQGRPWFRRDYVEVPGYPVGSTSLHTAQFVRRDVLMGEPWSAKRRRVAYDGLEVIGWQIRSPEVTAGAGVFFEIAVELTEPARGPIDLLLTARGPNDAVERWSLPLGHELLPPTEWEVGESWTGKWPLRLHTDLPEGSYRFELAVLHDGELMGPVRPSHPIAPGRADVRLGQGMRLVPGDEMRAKADEDLDDMREHAKKRSCFAAEEDWENALAHRIRSRDWREGHEPSARRTLAECWGNRGGKKANRLRETYPDIPKSEKEQDPDAYLEKAAWEIQRGRTWDPTAPRLLVTARRVALALEARSRTLSSQGKEDAAFAALALAARVDPSQAFLQRRVERWRARRENFEDRLGPLPP